MRHQLSQTEDGTWTCSVCRWTWKYLPTGTWKGVPMEECPGLPRYRHGEQPEHVATETELRRRGLKRGEGQEPAACSWWFDKRRWVYYYDVAEAVPRPKATPEQLAALEKAREAWRRLRTCTRCGFVAGWKLSGGVCHWCGHELMIESDRSAAAEWARQLLASPEEWVILDLETTGLDGDAEVVQVGVLSPGGVVLFDSLVRPSGPIPREATRIHGITDAMVVGAPTLGQLHAALGEVLRGRVVVAYNMRFDRGVLNQTRRRYRLQKFGIARWVDAMRPYSRWCGDWSDYWESYRWQALPGGDHTAIGDCRATLRIIQRMAADAVAEPA